MTHPGNSELGAGRIARSQVEHRSIQYVPEDERHGRVHHQGPFWFLGNLQFFTVSLGFIGPRMGLGFEATCIAAILGLLFGTAFMAFHASQGPELGMPQMIQSRAQFGYRGVIVPILGALFTFVGFNVVDTVLISQGLNNLLGWGDKVVSIVLAVTACSIAIYGYHVLHIVFRVLFWVSLPIFLMLSIGILGGGVQAKASADSSFTWIAFATQFAACASYNFTSAPCVSDYTRYLPSGRSPMRLIWTVYWGASLSAIWLVVIGAWLAVHQGASDGMVSIHSAGNQIFRHLGTITVLISVGSLVAAMATNAYSGMLSVVTIADSFMEVAPTRKVRIVGIVALALLWLVISLSLTANAVSILYVALAIMFYVLVPWTAVNLVDFFFVRHGRYAIDQFFVPNGVYSNWGWQGLTSYFVGLLASVPFIDLQGVYQGPIARHLGGVDIAWAPGLVVAGVLYATFMSFADLGPELQAIEEGLGRSALHPRTLRADSERFSSPCSKPSTTL